MNIYYYLQMSTYLFDSSPRCLLSAFVCFSVYIVQQWNYTPMNASNIGNVCTQLGTLPMYQCLVLLPRYCMLGVGII